MKKKRLQSVEEWVAFCKENANKHGFKIVWERSEGPMNPLEKMMLIVTECSEVTEAYRAQTKPNDGKNKIHCDNWKEHFEDEVADILIRLFHMCGDLDIDLLTVLRRKMQYNINREHLHGKLT